MTKTILKIFIITAVLTVAAACSKHTVEPPQRPSSEPDISSELLDASTRIDGPLLTLRYDDGGILFSRSSDGVISGVRLNDGIEFEYDPAAPLLIPRVGRDKSVSVTGREKKRLSLHEN